MMKIFKHTKYKRIKRNLGRVLLYIKHPNYSSGLCVAISTCGLFTRDEIVELISYIYIHRPKHAQNVMLSANGMYCSNYFWNRHDLEVRVQFVEDLIKDL